MPDRNEKYKEEPLYFIVEDYEDEHFSHRVVGDEQLFIRVGQLLRGYYDHNVFPKALIAYHVQRGVQIWAMSFSRRDDGSVLLGGIPRVVALRQPDDEF